MSEIAADPDELQDVGAELSDVGLSLGVATGRTDFGGGGGGGGASTPVTNRALSLCSADWSAGLGELGQMASAMGALAQGTSVAFRLAGG